MTNEAFEAQHIPTGYNYLKTRQGVIQLTELIFLLTTWAVISTQNFYALSSLIFAVGAFAFVWLITLIFFIFYLTGYHLKINYCCSKPDRLHKSSEREDVSADESSSADSFAWFVFEYISYFIFSLLLLVAAILVSMHITNSYYLSASVLSWICFIIYSVHFSLLLFYTEGMWPHEALVVCCDQQSDSGENLESESLLKSLPQPVITVSPS